MFQLVEQLCGGTTAGNYLYSSELFFAPGPIKGGHFEAKDSKRFGLVFVYSM